MTSENRPLRVFLCHSSHDKPAVRELYQKLRAEPWIQPWLDEEELYPGQDWNMEIEKAVEAADAIIVCLTKNSINKEGYIQRELRIVLDFADYKPEGTLYIMPVRLEECEPPRRLRAWQYADYFEGQRERALQRLLVSLKRRADSLELIFKKPALYRKPIKENKPIGENSLLESLFNKHVIIVENSSLESLYNKHGIILNNKSHSVHFLKPVDDVNALVGGKKYGWVKALSDNMNSSKPIPISENDFVLFYDSADADNNDIVIAFCSDGSGAQNLVVKRYSKTNQVLISEASTPVYAPIPIDGNVRIIGVVIAVAKPDNNNRYDELLGLVQEDRSIAERLIDYEKTMSPLSSKDECVEKAVIRLLRDRKDK